MDDSKKVVNLNEEPTPVINREAPELVETPAEQAQPTEEIAVIPEVAPIVPAPTVNSDVDEFGVPWKNRAMELRRKLEDTVDKLPQMIDEKLKTVNQPQTPTYTYEQLEVYKQQNQHDPNVVAWTVGEQRKIQLAENRKLIEEVTGQKDKQREFENGRQQAFQTVQNKYPDALVPNSPMFNLTKQYMQVPEIGNRSDGLFWAAKMARADLLETQTPVLQQKVQAQKADLKQAQKASLTEGAGRRTTVSVTPQQTAIESLRRTGSIKDAESAIGSILRQKGILGE